jgi:hypothetical protein
MLEELYDTSGNTEVLFILGGLQEDMGHYNDAYGSYQAYVDEAATGSHAEDAKKRMAALADKARGQLRIKTEPAGANVYRGEQKLGVTPFEAELPPGEYRVRLTKRGYLPKSGRVNVEAGDVTVANYVLESEDGTTDWGSSSDDDDDTSQISVRTDVKGALVTVDGVLIGTTLGRRSPITQSIDSGVHAVAVHRHGHTSWGAHLRAADGETLQLDLRLGKEQSRGAKLASWSVGGIGAASVLAGVGIGVGALLDDDESLADSADVMILGGLTAIAAGAVIHWATRSKPTQVKLRKAR